MSEHERSFERTLLAQDAVMKRGYSSLVKNCGKIIAALTAVIVLLVTFTEVGFYDVGARELTANLLLVLAASYIIYFSLEDAGEALARESEDYREALARLKELASKIDGATVADLRKFLAEYASAELKERREALLISEGIPPEELYAEANASTDKKTRRALRRAGRMKPIRVGVSSLLSERGRAEGEAIKSPEGKKVTTLILRLIPTTVCTLFTASVMLGLKDGLGVAEVIESLVRLCPLPIVALRGYSAGYSYVTGAEVEWIRARSRIIDAFLKSRGKCN